MEQVEEENQLATS